GIAKKRVRVRIPERGNGKKLCVMAAENALEYAEKTGRELSVSDSTAEKLGELLGCEVLPERIEAFDISGFGNECLTAGMIVCERGRFVKKDYRLFRMKTVGTQNDFASMKEAVGRRLARLAEQDAEEDAFSRWPDLILVDGGSAQLEAAREAAREQGVDVFIAGMVKDGSHRTRALVTADGIVDISREQDVFSLIYRIQEEIHRFTVRAMTDSKRKTVRRSSLEKIPGIGPSKAAKLLAAFGGLAGVKTALTEELASVRGITETDAERVYGFFHPKEGDEPLGEEN
ncbi:MAG: excinuclease ABC subunit C, partial [Clostridia bacterium]|nr:excinuclease ABC subunit C [Clostridia bacterium]